MAVGPFPLWRPVDPGSDPGEPSALPATLAEVQQVYRALAVPHYEAAGMTLVEVRRGFTPAEADDMELWVIADFLGVNDDPPDDGSPVIPSGLGVSLGEDATVLTEAEFAAQSRKLIEERLRVAAEVNAPGGG